MKRALITGITGQTKLLAICCWRKATKVHGIIRRASTFNTSRIDSSLRRFRTLTTSECSCTNGISAISVNLVKLLYALKPDEFIISAHKATCA